MNSLLDINKAKQLTTRKANPRSQCCPHLVQVYILSSNNLIVLPLPKTPKCLCTDGLDVCIIYGEDYGRDVIVIYRIPVTKSGFLVCLSLISGWICYAEKQLGSYILPYISSVKSPQQSMGAAIKHHICQTMGFR